jgi:hypothetical protein
LHYKKSIPEKNELGRRIAVGTDAIVSGGWEKINGAMVQDMAAVIKNDANLDVFNLMEQSKSFSLFESDRKKNERNLTRSISEKEKEIKALRTQTARKERAVQALDSLVTRKEQEVRSLTVMLEDIRSSKAWKTLLLFRRIRVMLIPPNSLRGRVLRRLITLFFVITGRIRGNKLFRNSLLLKKVIDQNDEPWPQSVKITFNQMDGGKNLKNNIPLAKNKYALIRERSIIIAKQDKLLNTIFSAKTTKLILFIVPGWNGVNGGIMSICSLASVSVSLKEEHGSEVIITTPPKSPPFLKFTMFENPFTIFRFDQILSYFRNLDKFIIHIPEMCTADFLKRLSAREKRELRSIPNLQINIMNQNIWLMPGREVIAQLKELTSNITCTTAHRKYCTYENSRNYGIPFHLFSASNLTRYYYAPFSKKENIVVCSHDIHEMKEKILDQIINTHEEISIRRVENMPYEEYKRLIYRAKWVITFGEGLDGYFVEAIRSGAIPFAVYNEDFFSDRFKNLPNVYQSYDEMLARISEDISMIGKPTTFKALSRQLIELDKLEYNDEEYKENIRRFYRKEYTCPLGKENVR